jgi:YbbR domain-containing protein
MMPSLRYWITNNLFLKVFSVVLAVALWSAVAGDSSSEIGIAVPLEYKNVPPQFEITGETTDTVEVRLRAASKLIREISPKEVSTAIDLSGMESGERVIALTAQNVEVPFDVEVIRINPPRVHLNLEPTLVKRVAVVPELKGQPRNGYEVKRVLLSPSTVEIEGPQSRVTTFDSVRTRPISLQDKKSDISQSVDLDLADNQVRLQHPSSIGVRVEIRLKQGNKK